MSLQEFLRNLQKANLSDAALKVVEANDEQAISLNVDDQLFEKGIRSDGKQVGEYSLLTKRIKAAKGQRYDHMTLRDTTNFHDSFFMDASKWPVMLDARDWKTAMLKEEYGNDIFGLTKENTDRFGKSILPEIQTAFKKELGL